MSRSTHQRVSTTLDDGKDDTNNNTTTSHAHEQKQKKQQQQQQQQQFLKVPPEAICKDHLTSGKSLNLPSQHIKNEQKQKQERDEMESSWSDTIDQSYNAVNDIKHQLDLIWSVEPHPYTSWAFKCLLASDLFKYVYKNNLIHDNRLIDVKSKEIRHALDNIRRNDNDMTNKTIVLDGKYEFQVLPNQPIKSYTQAAQRYNEHHSYGNAHADDGDHPQKQQNNDSKHHHNPKHYDVDKLNIPPKDSQINDVYTHYKARDESQRISDFQRDYFQHKNRTPSVGENGQQKHQDQYQKPQTSDDDATAEFSQVYTLKPQDLWNKEHQITDEQLEQQRSIVEAVIQQHDLMHHLRQYNYQLSSQLTSQNNPQPPPEKFKYVHSVPHHPPHPPQKEDLSHVIELLHSNKSSFEQLTQLKRDENHLCDAARTFFKNQFIIHELLHDIKSNEIALHTLSNNQLTNVIDSLYQKETAQSQARNNTHDKSDNDDNPTQRASVSSSLRELSDAPPFKPSSLFIPGYSQIQNNNRNVSSPNQPHYRRSSMNDASTSSHHQYLYHQPQQQQQFSQPSQSQQTDSAVVLISVAEYNRLLGLSHHHNNNEQSLNDPHITATTPTKIDQDIPRNTNPTSAPNTNTTTRRSINEFNRSHKTQPAVPASVVQLSRPGSATSTTSTSSRGADGLTRKERRKVFWLKYLSEHPEEAKNNPLAKKHQMYATNKHQHHNIQQQCCDNTDNVTTSNTNNNNQSSTSKRRSSVSNYIQNNDNTINRTINLDPIAITGDQKDPLEFEFTVF